jgi:hypothetical protein
MKNPKELEIEKWNKYYQNLNSFMQPNEYLLKLLLGNFEGKKTFLKVKTVGIVHFLISNALILHVEMEETFLS